MKICYCSSRKLMLSSDLCGGWAYGLHTYLHAGKDSYTWNKCIKKFQTKPLQELHYALESFVKQILKDYCLNIIIQHRGLAYERFWMAANLNCHGITLINCHYTEESKKERINFGNLNLPAQSCCQVNAQLLPVSPTMSVKGKFNLQQPSLGFLQPDAL